MGIEIIEINANDSDIKLFHQIPQQIYQQDPYYLSPKTALIKQTLARPHQKIFIAMRNNTPLARVVARYSTPETRDEQALGQLAFFEAQDSLAAVKILFDCALEWLAQRNVALVKGPVDTDMWHSARLSLGPFKQSPFFLEPYNPSYYPELWENYGFSTAQDYYSREVADLEYMMSRLKYDYDSVIERGFSFRQFRKGNRPQEMQLIYSIAQNTKTTDFVLNHPDYEIFSNLITRLQAYLVEKYIYFVCDPSGKEVGFIVALPDFFEPLQIKNLYPRRWLAATLAKRRVNTLNIMAIAILPDYQRHGLGSALSYKLYQTAWQAGFIKANSCLLRESSPADKINNMSGTVFRRYRSYKYEL